MQDCVSSLAVKWFEASKAYGGNDGRQLHAKSLELTRLLPQKGRCGAEHGPGVRPACASRLCHCQAMTFARSSASLNFCLPISHPGQDSSYLQRIVG